MSCLGFYIQNLINVRTRKNNFFLWICAYEIKKEQLVCSWPVWIILWSYYHSESRDSSVFGAVFEQQQWKASDEHKVCRSNEGAFLQTDLWFVCGCRSCPAAAASEQLAGCPSAQGTDPSHQGRSGRAAEWVSAESVLKNTQTEKFRKTDSALYCRFCNPTMFFLSAGVTAHFTDSEFTFNVIKLWRSIRIVYFSKSGNTTAQKYFAGSNTSTDYAECLFREIRDSAWYCWIIIIDALMCSSL